MLSEASSPGDFEVTHADHLAGALERLGQGTFAVILLDLSLPNSSGLETVKRVRAAAPRTPMVVLSGQDDEEVALRALHMGAQDYLVKGRGDGDLMVRSIRYSIERERTEEALRQRLRFSTRSSDRSIVCGLTNAKKMAKWPMGTGHLADALDLLILDTTCQTDDKGKPAARRGRKATGLS